MPVVSLVPAKYSLIRQAKKFREISMTTYWFGLVAFILFFTWLNVK